MSKPVFPSLNDNALKVLEKRNYLWHKPDGQRETVDEMFRRVARFIASAENKFKVANPRYSAAEFEEIAFRLMRGLKFIPNTPTIVNAGRPNGQLAACYVLPLEDSMEGIMDTLKAQALVQKSGGGTGFSFSCIREKDSYIKSTGMKAVGPIPVIKLMNYLMTNFIIQGGVRHGANMGVLPCDHPDIEEFITFKDKDGSCASFNVSVGATDEFMQAVLDDGEITLVSRAGGHDKKKRARDIFDLIATYAWRTGDPGLLFLDTIERFNPTPHLGRLEATNPCGEQALLPNEACTLGHFNLAQYVHNGEFDFAAFESDIEYGVRFLDNVIEVNSYALPVIEKMHRDTNRKIGLGVMGFADALIMMGISYSSSKARELGGRIARALRLGADAASEALGVERGSFGAFVGSEVEKSWTHMRNACRTTVAPTGTTGMIAGVSTGIEPVFSFGLKREQAGMIMYEWHPLFEAWLESKDEETQASINSYYDKHGSLVGCQYIDGDEERIFIQANDVKYRDHVEMQAVWQKHIDNAISKTINLANNATIQDIKDAYILAWKSGCKGITVYRDGCRAHQALSSAGSSTMAGSLTGGGVIGAAQHQWTTLAGPATSTSSPAYTNLHGVTFTSTHTNPITASDQSASATAKMLSVNSGIPGGFAKMLQGTTQSGMETIGYNHVQDMVTVDEDKDCPECKAPALENSGGCSTCRGCGYSVCSI